MNEFGQTWTQFLGETSAHGFAHILSSKKILSKFMWPIVIITMAIFALILVQSSIQDYMKYDIISNEITRKVDSLDFPVVTICHLKNTNATLKSSSILFKKQDVKSVTHFHIADRQCMQINTASEETEILKTVVEGALLGLSIHLEYDALDKLSIFISDQNIRPTLMELDNNIVIFNNRLQVSLKKVVTKKLGEPYDSCIKDTDQYRESNLTYRQINCLEIAGAANIADICNCSYTGVYEKKGYPSCFDSEKSDCTLHLTVNLNFSLYYDRCPLECDSVHFETQSMSYYTQRSGFGFRIDIFYDKLEVTEKSEIAKTTAVGLISAVGGNVGLFLGMSFFTMFEFAKLIVDWGLILSKHMWKYCKKK